MYRYEFLSNKNIDYFKNLNSSRTTFNKQNKEFFSFYNNSNFIKKILLKKKVILLKYNKEYLGYLWYRENNDSYITINSMYIDESKVKEFVNVLSCYRYLLGFLKNYMKISYVCEVNNDNAKILSKLGFIKKESTIELSLDINNYYRVNLPPDVTIHSLIKGQEEKIRCEIQNDIFKSDCRIPLSIEDIYFDELQDYYYDKGAFFLKLNDEYIGYGQIIFENKEPYMVNFGIVKKYRNKGYGKPFLLSLINILKDNGFNKVKLRVNYSNIVALNLYLNVGFNMEKEIIFLEYNN